MDIKRTRRKLTFSILIILLYGCSTQKIIKEYKHPKTQMTTKMLNVKALEKAENKTTEAYVVRVNRTWVSLGKNYPGPIKGEGYSSVSYKKVDFKTQDVIKIKRISPELYRYTKTNPNNKIKLLCLFYIDGSLKMTGEIFTGKPVKGILTPYEFKIGTWKTYDKFEAIQESINYDSYFPFTLKDIFKYLKDKKLELISEPYLSYYDPNKIFKLISRDIVNNKGVWKLRIVTDNKKYDHKWITIDGNTGRLLESGYVKENLY